MQFSRCEAEIFVPDGLPPEQALGRITHLGIGAHPDDLEFMALHGIIACHDSETRWFGGITCGDGAGSARTGAYAGIDDDEMRRIRREEQNRAARIGRYGVMIQLGYPSTGLRDPRDPAPCGDLAAILRAVRPGSIVYTHNLADKHPTHVAVAVTALRAMRSLPLAQRPAAVHGCEVWRGLDWMLDHEKTVHDLSGQAALADALVGAFDSQISGGKRYDLGVNGRWHANATFFDPHAVDRLERAALAMDLTPLVRDDSLDLADYVEAFIGRFRDDVRARLRTLLE